MSKKPEFYVGQRVRLNAETIGKYDFNYYKVCIDAQKRHGKIPRGIGIRKFMATVTDTSKLDQNVVQVRWDYPLFSFDDTMTFNWTPSHLEVTSSPLKVCAATNKKVPIHEMIEVGGNWYDKTYIEEIV